MKGIFRFIRNIILLVIFIGLICSYFLYKKGEDLYLKTIKEKSLDQAVSEVMASEDYVPFDEISPYFVDALVSIEDRRFFDRLGMDYISIVRAVLTNVENKAIVEGASTITQQLTKNLYFSHEALVDRKMAEVFFVRDFENKYSKEEIFAMYASIIYYGDGYEGIKAAAKGYFNKTPAELDLYEASLLAGLPQSPSNYQLSTGRDKAKVRQEAVLNAMVDNGCVTQEEVTQLLNEMKE